MVLVVLLSTVKTGDNTTVSTHGCFFQWHYIKKKWKGHAEWIWPGFKRMHQHPKAKPIFVRQSQYSTLIYDLYYPISNVQQISLLCIVCMYLTFQWPFLVCNPFSAAEKSLYFQLWWLTQVLRLFSPFPILLLVLFCSFHLKVFPFSLVHSVWLHVLAPILVLCLVWIKSKSKVDTLTKVFIHVE